VLTNHVETLLHTWAELAPERPTPVFRQAPAFPSVLVDAHIAVAKKMSPAATLDYVTLRLEQGQEIIGEIVLRIVQELGPELGQKLLDTVQFSTWGVTIPPKRLDVEALAGRARRQRLSAIARDVERALGPVRRHDEAGPARELLAQGAIS